MKDRHLKTEADILAAYGGKRKMAEWFEISLQAVCNWFGEGASGIPTGYQYRIHLWAASKGFVLHPGAFGLSVDGKPLRKATAKAA